MLVSFATLMTWMYMAMSTRRSGPASAAVAGPEPAVLDADFPDPSVVQDVDGTWYAFATEHAGVHVQAARARGPSGPWTRLAGVDLLPDSGDFFTGANTWAPDVRVLGAGRYVLYFSGEVAGNASHHCVGVATASRILGPYTPRAAPLRCDLADGGDIDPAGFVDDADGRAYVVYKVDGNSVGAGGECGNGVAPRRATPILLQEVAADGARPVGDPRPILDRVGAESLVEAPALHRARDGTYVLFFSSGCYSEPSYNIHYATAPAVAGPYTRGPAPLAVSGDALGLVSPGGASTVPGRDMLVFHVNCPAGRCMYEREFELKDRLVRLL